MRFHQFLLISILFFSCSKEKEKIDFLKKELQIEIPSEVKVINDELVHNELILPDYTLKLTLSLSSNQIEKIKEQIISVPYYDELEYYRWKDNSRHLMDNGSYSFKTIQDSIANTKYRGSWIKTESGYEFVDFGKTQDIVNAWLNTETNSLEFVFVGM